MAGILSVMYNPEFGCPSWTPIHWTMRKTIDVETSAETTRNNGDLCDFHPRIIGDENTYKMKVNMWNLGSRKMIYHATTLEYMQCSSYE